VTDLIADLLALGKATTAERRSVEPGRRSSRSCAWWSRRRASVRSRSWPPSTPACPRCADDGPGIPADHGAGARGRDHRGERARAGQRLPGDSPRRARRPGADRDL